MPPLPDAERTGFPRDRMTIAFYGCFAVWGWLLYSFNPSVPLLADELGISDAQAGLHGTAMAAGGILAAFVTPRLVRGRGRRAAILLASGVRHNHDRHCPIQHRTRPGGELAAQTNVDAARKVSGGKFRTVARVHYLRPLRLCAQHLV